MTMIHEDKPSLEELAHFGVKGMQWGVRNHFPKGGRPTGSISDRIIFGKKGTEAIQKRVLNGMTPRNARILSSGRAATRAVLAIWGALILKDATMHGITNAVLAKNTARLRERGQKEALAITAKAAAMKFAKKRRGAFKITTL